MNNKFMAKVFGIGVVLLFVGASVLSSVIADIENADNEENLNFLRIKDYRLDLKERINSFKNKNMNLGQIQKFNPVLFGGFNGWSPTELVSSESTENSSYCLIDTDASGAVHVVWQDETDYGGSGSDVDIFYKMKPNGGEWAATEVVSSESSIESEIGSLAVEPDGTVHVTWDEWSETSNDVYYKMKPSGGSWTAAELISIEGCEYSGISSLAVESDGTVHVALNGFSGYYEVDIYYKMKPSGGDWTAAEEVVVSPADSFYPSLAVDQDSNVHVAWTEMDYYSNVICYKMKPDGGDWSEGVILSSNFFAFLSSIDVGLDGAVHVVFDELDFHSGWICVFYRMKPSDGGWLPAELVTDDFDGDGFFSSLSVDSSGVVHVAWQGMLLLYDESFFEDDIYYKNNNYVNLPPETPSITGDLEGKNGKEYDYTFVTTDPNGNNVFYYIDWNDSMIEEWIGPYGSGEEVKVNHTWEEKGTYVIKAKAKDIFDAESEWNSLEVTMPKNKLYIFKFPLLNWLFNRFPHAFPILRYIFGLI